MSYLEEKYGRAVRSSHLETGSDAIDVVIAAGWATANPRDKREIEVLGVPANESSLGADLLRLRIERDAISRLPGHRLAFPLLKSMAVVRVKLTRYAAQEAGCDENSAELKALIGKVLDLFLDPNCTPCGGTGKIGAFGSAMPMCPTCRGSTKRAAMWPSSEAESLAGWLQSQMESKIDSALRKMNRMLRQN